MKKYKQTLDYLFNALPMYQRVGKTAFKKDLKNIKAFMRYLGDPHTQFRSIHIAGTNGKGSSAHMLSAILQQKYKKVALYTSPHYKDFRERIKINSDYITQQEVVEFVQKHKAFIESVQPSFFEITVAMAFNHFASEEVDIAVIETGLGGRLDSTNVIKPLLSIITNISFDHQSMLGNTLKKIAGEKAGIIKSKVPVVIGEYHRETASVFKTVAQKKKAKIYFASKTFKAESIQADFEGMRVRVKRRGQRNSYAIQLNANGPFQHLNLQTVLQSVEVLNHTSNVKISKRNIREGLSQIRKLTAYQGRWQWLSKEPRILADSGHNEAGLTMSLDRLKKIEFAKQHFVLGFVNDKSLDKLLKKFPKEASYYFTQANIPRALDAYELKLKAARYGLDGRHFSSTKKALAAAKKNAKKEDLIFIGGSTFVVAELI